MFSKNGTHDLGKDYTATFVVYYCCKKVLGRKMYEIEVNERISRKHPAISSDDVRIAWTNAIKIIERSGGDLPDAVLVAVGFDSKGRLLEMVGVILPGDKVHVFHALTPPTKKLLREMGIAQRKGLK